ncbi:MAG: hypothetical protein ACXWCB_03575 [Acidimicrobiales bacterium]
MSQADLEAPTSSASPGSRWWPWAAGNDERARRAAHIRLARWTFVVAAVASVPMLLFWLGRYFWFYWDEWDFLAGRTAWNLHDLVRPHNEHWSTLPVLAFRAAFQVFGLNSYRPYQLMIVLCHIAVATLLRVIMRRVGVGPWIATLLAVVLLFFGPGSQNIVWAFQIGFVGAVAFGLMQFVLTDHDGPVDRRDWLGLACGLAALMCSGVGVAMVFGVGVAVLVRRGWRLAAFSTVPLAAIYGLWWLSQPPKTSENPNHLGPVQFARAVLDFARAGIGATFRSIAYFPYGGWVLAAVLVAGVVLALQGRKLGELRNRYAIVVGVFASGFAFLLSSASGRAALGPAFARASRYEYLGLVFLLPLFGVALSAIARRSAIAGLVVGLMFLSVIPGNVTKFEPGGIVNSQYFAAMRRTLFSVPDSPFADQVPSWATIDPISARDATVGWFEATDRDGRMPSAPALTDAPADGLELRLTVQQSGDTRLPDDGSCQELTGPVVLDEPVGQPFHVGGPPATFTMKGSRGTVVSVTYQPAFGSTFSIELPDRPVTLTPGKPNVLNGPTVLCR